MQTTPAPPLQVFFTKEWANLLETSFRNFLAEVIQKLPLPAILCFNTDRVQRQGLQKKVDQLQVQAVSVCRLAEPGLGGGAHACRHRVWSAEPPQTGRPECVGHMACETQNAMHVKPMPQ